MSNRPLYALSIMLAVAYLAACAVALVRDHRIQAAKHQQEAACSDRGGVPVYTLDHDILCIPQASK